MKYRRLRLEGATYFFTVVTHARQPIFSEQWAIALLLGEIEAVRRRRRFEIDAFVILTDHLHIIWSLPDGDSDFSTRWMLIKSNFARNWRRRTSSSISPWQGRYWEHLIRDDEDFANHIEYIHYNPVKHGLAAAPVEWPVSSFHDFVSRGDYDAEWGSSEVPQMKPIDRRSE